MENISNILKSLRLQNNLSQMELSKLANVSQSTIANIEKGRNEATTSTLINLSNYFKISIDYLVGRELEDGTIILNNSKENNLHKNTLLICDNLCNEHKYELSKEMSNALIIIFKNLKNER